MGRLRFTGAAVGQASRARLAVERIDELLRAQPTVPVPDVARAVSSTALLPALALEDVGVRERRPDRCWTV